MGFALVVWDRPNEGPRCRLNKWVTFVQETSYIDTRAASQNVKFFRGIHATQAHSWRNEFGTIFTF